jgi:NAD(P)-dependent dehydrogenase (short-subunit alcohol dehydrogenase family)
MDLALRGRTALVLGAGGLGRAIAISLGQGGTRLALAISMRDNSTNPCATSSLLAQKL